MSDLLRQKRFRSWSSSRGTCAIFLGFALLLTVPAANTVECDCLAEDLVRAYREIPSLRHNYRTDDLHKGISAVLGPELASRLSAAQKSNPGCLYNLRQGARFQSASQKPRRLAIVSGLSVSGLMAVAVLAGSGYEVIGYEKRDSYTRNIQWVGRQAVLDELASIDTELAEYVRHEVVGPVSNGAVKIVDEPYARTVSQRGPPTDGDPRRLPRYATEMFEVRGQSNFVVETQVFEETMRRFAEGLGNVVLNYGTTAEVHCDRLHRGVCGVGQHQDPDLIVVAEGANSSTRTRLGIRTYQSGPPRPQVAGEINIDLGGKMGLHRRSESLASSHKYYLTGFIARGGSGKTWIVGDLSEAFLNKHCKWDESSANVECPEELVTDQLREIASQSMEIPIDEVRGAPIAGPVTGSMPAQFVLLQQISETAFHGTNLVFLGDAVGTGHWIAGGGMQVASVSHIERLKQLLLSIDLDEPREEALRMYSRGVIEDTFAWQLESIDDFYPHLPPAEVQDCFRTAIAQWTAGRGSSPYEYLEELLESIRIGATPTMCTASFASDL